MKKFLKKPKEFKPSFLDGKKTYQKPPSPPFSSKPLCVDLDGSLIGTDVTLESLTKWMIQKPLRILKIPFMLLKGRGHFKRQLANCVTLDVTRLSYNREILQILQERRLRKEPSFLVTAADQKVADPIGEFLGVFDGVLGSDGQVNLRRHEKAKALVERFGEKGFSYVGNSKDDLTVWKKAYSGIGVGIAPSIETQIKCGGLNVKILSRRRGPFKEILSLLSLTPWSWAFCLFLGCLIQGVLTVTALLEFFLLLLSGAFGALLSFLVQYARQEKFASKTPFCAGKHPLTIGYIVLGSCALGLMGLLPFLPVGGWIVGVTYGVGSYGAAWNTQRFLGHLIYWGLGLVALLGGLVF